MILTVDIGNSNIVIGGYQNDALTFITRFATDRKMEADQYALQLVGLLSLYKVNPAQIEGVILSSVVPRLTHAVGDALGHVVNCTPLLLNRQNAQITVKTDNPDEVGADIIASAIALKGSYPLPAVIIDMGTATTLTALDAEGAVLGVSIYPGLYISLDALTAGTSQLKGIALEAPARAIGTNTADSMQSGMIFGTAAMLDGMIDRFAAELGSVETIIATGGGAKQVIPHCRHKILFSDTMLLDGLYKTYKLMQQ
ncbi:MAG: type III pantothenate kinase [Oscillospiraceae bacterium]|nr:type III pantothenate kinase [Oscillospiraceae bacterium]